MARVINASLEAEVMMPTVANGLTALLMQYRVGPTWSPKREYGTVMEPPNVTSHTNAKNPTTNFSPLKTARARRRNNNEFEETDIEKHQPIRTRS